MLIDVSRDRDSRMLSLSDSLNNAQKKLRPMRVFLIQLSKPGVYRVILINFKLFRFELF